MLKKLLLLGAIIAIIPLDRDKQAEFFEVAKATISDLGGFCDRNPRVCLKSQDAISTFTSKAEAGARMVVEIVNEKNSKGQTAADGARDSIAALLQATGHSKAPSQNMRAPAKTAVLPTPIGGDDRLPAYGDQYSQHYGGQSQPVDPNALLPVRNDNGYLQP